MRRFIWLLLFTGIFFSCTNTTTVATTDNANVDSASINGHVGWINNGNVYEVNVRQYTPEGTFKALEAHFQRLHDMGVQTLWFMPINPISKKDRKGVLGSYYAIADYTAVNPEYGTMGDWKALVKKAHDMGFKVIIDWVPNHTGADHPWLTSHQDFYELDSVTRQPISPFDWTDVRQLNFKNVQMQDSMLAAMKFWVTETDIDGFRCDHVEEFQSDFWKKAIPELRKHKSLLMLAEAEQPWVYDLGFDMSYAWTLFHTTVDVAKGIRTPLSIDSVLHKRDSTLSSNILQLAFTSNHDENSWNKADYGTMPGASHAPFAVLTQTLNKAVPLVYSGQEEPVLDSISFFYKDTITFNKLERMNFYKTLLSLRKNNPALSANASFTKLKTNNDKAIYAYERESNGNKVIVILNLSNGKQEFQWVTPPSETGQLTNIFLGKPEAVSTVTAMEPWGSVVYEKRK